MEINLKSVDFFLIWYWWAGEFDVSINVLIEVCNNINILMPTNSKMEYTDKILMFKVAVTSVVFDF